jgi:hypothetical protein
MRESTRRSIIRRLCLYSGVLGLVAMVWLLEVYMQNRTQAAGVYGSLIDALTPLQEKQLSAFMQMNQLLITLGTTLLGAMGFLLVGRRGARSFRELWAPLMSALCVGLSLYFGYRAYADVIQMFQPPFPTFDLTGSLILWDRYAHFFTFLLGAFFFLDFAFQEVSKEDLHEPVQYVPYA